MNVNVGPTVPEPTHDLSLSDGSTTYGFNLAQGPRSLQEIPLSPPAQQFDIEQKSWIGGRGRLRYSDDPTGYYDAKDIWSLTDGKLLNGLQWRFAKGIRNCDESLPGDNSTMTWYKLYDTSPAAAGNSQYLTIAFAASASYNADKAYLWVRKKGTPTGNLTLELCADGTNKPGAVAVTATLTPASVTDTLSIYQVFDWASTTALTATTTYYLKIYGPTGDTVTNHWEILCASTGSGLCSPTGADDAWTAANVAPYYRVVDADIARKWWFFMLQGEMYACSQNDAGTASVLFMNGVRGKATSATGTTLVNSGITMTADRFIGCYLRIINGTGDGQVRLIADNDATSFTVATWNITPDNTSEYVVYGTPWWGAATGTTGLGAVVNQPIVADKIVYFPQGTGTAIRRMRVNASSHDYAADGSLKADILYVYCDESEGPQVVRADDKKSTSTISFSKTKAWGNNLVFGPNKPIGSNAYMLTNMIDYNGVLNVMKEDGPYTWDGKRIKRVGTGFADVPDDNNGKACVVQDQYLYFSWGHSVEKMLGKSVSDQLNWKQGYDGLPSNRRGPVVAAISVVGWLFFVVDGGASNYSSVICWNGLGWSEIFRGWATGVRIRNIGWQPCPETRGRLWIDVNGELVYIEFPENAANPTKDTTLNYQHEGVYISSTIDGNDANLYKLFHHLRLLIDQGSVDVDYQTDTDVGSETWTNLGTASTAPVTDITTDQGGKFQIRYRLRLQLTNSRTPTILSGTVCNGRMMQPAKYQWVGRYTLGSDDETKTSEPEVNPNTRYAKLQDWATKQTKLTQNCVVSSAHNKVVTISLPARETDWVDTSESGIGGQVSFVAMET